MRIWLDPFKLQQLRPDAERRRAARSQAQNTQVSAGQIGGQPAVQGQQLNATVTAQSRLQTPEQFRNIVLKTEPDGATVQSGRRGARGTGRAKLRRRQPLSTASPAAGIAIQLAPGANALTTADAVKARVEQLAPTFPPGVEACPIPSTPRPSSASRSSEVDQDADRGHRAGRPGDVRVPAELARDADPDDRRARRAARHLRRAGRRRLFDQHADHVRAWCWPSACWSTTPSWWSRTSSA